MSVRVKVLIVGRLARKSAFLVPVPSARWIWNAGDRNRRSPDVSFFWVSSKYRVTRGLAAAVGSPSLGAAFDVVPPDEPHPATVKPRAQRTRTSGRTRRRMDSLLPRPTTRLSLP